MQPIQWPEAHNCLKIKKSMLQSKTFLLNSKENPAGNSTGMPCSTGDKAIQKNQKKKI